MHIDGNDYWVWEELDIKPEVVIMEYNSVLGIENAWNVLYKADFYRTDAHFSNLYWGASLKALTTLATKKGYTFIGTNINANNAYFVRNDKVFWGNSRSLLK